MSGCCSRRHDGGMSAVTSPVDATAPATSTTGPASAAPPARAAAVLAVVVALVGAVLGPTGQFDGLLGGGVTVASGTVEVLDGDTWTPAPAGRALPRGSIVRAPDGTATLDVPGGAVDLADGTRLTVDRALALRAGAVVVRSGEITVGDGIVTATGQGPWRFDATGRVGAYGGAPLLTDAAGRETLVRSFQEARVAEGVVEGAPRPYVYVGSDPFDRQHLAPAIDVDAYVGSLRRGLAADYGTAPQSRAFYRDFVGLRGDLVTTLEDIGFEHAGDRVGPPADVLVASVVTDALVADAGLSPREASTEVRAQRLAGATWGLIVQARDLDASHVRAAADRALALRQQQEDEGTATPALPPVTADTPDEDGDGGPAADDPATPDPSGPDEDGGGDDGEEVPEPDDDQGVVGDIVDETGATDVLPEPLREPVEDTVDVVDEVIEPLTGSSTSGEDGGDSLLDTTDDLVEETTESVEGTVGGLLGGG